jgi:hypothetical protein
MEIGRERSVLAESERLEFLREGRMVLRRLGGRRLAREFGRRATTALTHEELAELLLSCLMARRSR